jgi:hypothetical protein
MNVGIYIDTLVNTKQLEMVALCINDAIEKKLVKDASIFYDDVGHNPFNIKCGMFNSTDLWNFSGNLIVTSLNTALKSINIVNNLNLFYYYGLENKPNTLDLLHVLENNLEIICNSDSDAAEIYRTTGKQPLGISNNFQDIIQIIKRYYDGCPKNSKNVCRAE